MNEMFTRAACGALKKIGEHLPQILTIAGGVCIVAGTIEVAKKADKAKVIKENLDASLADAREVREKVSEEEYTKADYDHDITMCYVRFLKDEFKCIGLGGGLVLGGITMMGGSSILLSNKNRELSTALATVTASYAALKQNIDAHLPEEYAAALKFSGKPVKPEEVNDHIRDDLKLKKNGAEIDTDYVNYASPYAKFFDSGSKYFMKHDPEANRKFVLKVQSMANDMCRARGSLSLNDILAILDIPQQEGFNRVGWVWGPGLTNKKNPISFNIYNCHIAGNRDFVNAGNYDNCEAPAVLLDFNVTGVI